MRVPRAFFVLALASVSGCSLIPLPSGATEQSVSSYQMWALFGWVGLFVAALVYGLIFWCIVRFRSRPGDASFPVQFRRNSAMEVVYTVLPLLLVGGLFAYSYAAERHIETIAPHPAMVVEVEAFRWSWRFSYPTLGVAIVGTPAKPPELVLPVGETIRFDVTSLDVDHSFWIPGFLFKRDAIPGLRNVFDLTPKRLGTFRGQCGEFCGLDHALMLFDVRVVTPPAFAAWARAHAPAKAHR